LFGGAIVLFVCSAVLDTAEKRCDWQRRLFWNILSRRIGVVSSYTIFFRGGAFFSTLLLHFSLPKRCLMRIQIFFASRLLYISLLHIIFFNCA